MSITVARAPVPILLWLGMRLFIGEIAVIVGLSTPGLIGRAVLIVGALVLLYGGMLAVHVLTLKLRIAPGTIEVRSTVIRRRYQVGRLPPERYPTPVSRGTFGTVVGMLGIELGRGREPGSGRPLEVIRLAATESIVLIDCRTTTLAVVPTSERTLLAALARCARSPA
ncbi:MAG TPA: hypothetical protein VFW95_07375 [Candidatus Limnocylindria bacterium]|nr:hypothetical protein [Candidatus Limnocylindria bacterium]